MFGAQRVRPLGHMAEEMGLQSTQPQNSAAETTLPDPCSARRDKPSPSASHFPLERSPGWKLQVSGAIYRGEFPLQNPESQRAGAVPPGPSPCSVTLSRLRQRQNQDFPASGRLEHSDELILFVRSATCGSVAVSLWLWCLLSWSLLQAPWSIGWCQGCFPPSFRIWDVIWATSKHSMLGSTSKHNVLGFLCSGLCSPPAGSASHVPAMEAAAKHPLASPFQLHVASTKWEVLSQTEKPLTLLHERF